MVKKRTDGSLAFLRRAARDYGARWLLRRAWYEAQLRTGWHRVRFRRRSWAADELVRHLRADRRGDALAWASDWKRNRRPHFVDALVRLPDRARRLRGTMGLDGLARLRADADAALRGSLRYFSDRMSPEQAAFDWHRNPFTGQATDPTAHWTRVPMFSPATGDLKFIWEPGRFGAAYLLVRAWAALEDERYAEGFWRLVESWGDANPPHHGAHWKCGQETALRIMAWAFALHAFADSPATTPARVARLVGMLAAQADRVASDRVYAELQGNNHSISEGVGLWTAGLLFPDLSHAAQWTEHGREILERDAQRLVNPDGSFAQKSNNYHRVLLQDYLYAVRLGAANGREFSGEPRRRLAAAAQFIAGMLDPVSGRVPNFGANDGALMTPLNSCDYQDFRPVAEAASVAFGPGRRLPSGAWHEDLLWFFGPAAVDAPTVADPARPLCARDGGCFTLHGADSWALLRCPTFRDRPGHADALHLDLWRRGENVAIDAGSYLYYAAGAWANGFATSLAHNTVTLDGLDQMDRGPRFMWTGWLRSRLWHCEEPAGGQFSYCEGEHDGYQRLPAPALHRRAVLRAEHDVWIVVDDVSGTGEHDVRLHWLLADAPHALLPGGAGLRLALASGDYDLRVQLIDADGGRAAPAIARGDETSPLGGWHSPFYGRREPALAAAWNVRRTLPVRAVSVFCPPETDLTHTTSGVEWALRGARFAATFNAVGEAPLVTSVRGTGADGHPVAFSFPP